MFQSKFVLELVAFTIMKLGCLLSRDHRKTGLLDLLRVTKSLSCGELHHPSGLQGKRFVRFRIGFTCCEFRSRRGNALGIWKRVESLLHKQWNPGATQGWLLRLQGRCVSCEWLGRSVDLDKRRGSDPGAGAASWTGSTSGSGNVLASRLQIRYALDSTRLLH